MVRDVVEANVGDVGARRDGDAEGPAGAVRVEVVHRVLVVPRAVPVVGGVGGQDQQAVVRHHHVGRDHRGVVGRPGADGRLLTHGGPVPVHVPAAVQVAATDVDAAVGGVVGLVAGRGVVRGDVVALAVEDGVGVRRGVDVRVRDLDPLVDRVAALALSGEGVVEGAGRGVHLEARAQPGLAAVQGGAVGIRAPDAEARARARALAGAAEALLERGEAVLQPREAHLLEAAVLVPVDVLADDGVLVRAGDPEQLGVADVAGRRADGVRADTVVGAVLRDAVQVPHDDVGTRGRVGAATAAARAAGRDVEAAGAAGVAVPGADLDEVGLAGDGADAHGRLQVARVVVAADGAAGRAAATVVDREDRVEAGAAGAQRDVGRGLGRPGPEHVAAHAGAGRVGAVARAGGVERVGAVAGDLGGVATVVGLGQRAAGQQQGEGEDSQHGRVRRGRGGPGGVAGTMRTHGAPTEFHLSSLPPGGSAAHPRLRSLRAAPLLDTPRKTGARLCHTQAAPAGGLGGSRPCQWPPCLGARPPRHDRSPAGRPPREGRPGSGAPGRGPRRPDQKLP